MGSVSKQASKKFIIINQSCFNLLLGEELYHVQVDVKEFPSFYISKNCESKIYEGMATYTVNDKSGWGIAEWQYRNFIRITE